MSFPINPPNAPLVDERGFVTREWYRYFSNIWQTIGVGDPFADQALIVPEGRQAKEQDDVLVAPITAVSGDDAIPAPPKAACESEGLGLTPPMAGIFLPLSGGTMFGAILAAEGSAALPGYAFSGDPDTGFSHPSDNAIAVSAAGTERMRLTATGLGIGEVAPAEKLHVIGNVMIPGGYGWLVGGDSTDDFTDSGVTIPHYSLGWETPSGIGGKVLHASAYFGIRLYTAGVERLRIVEGGGVGIQDDVSIGGDLDLGLPGYKLGVAGQFAIAPGNLVGPVNIGDIVFEFTNDTTITIKAKGSDGTVRGIALTIA